MRSVMIDRVIPRALHGIHASACRRLATLALAAVTVAPAAAQQFFHFESPHVHPMAMTPDGQLLLAVNTVDARLEVFRTLPRAPHLEHLRSIPVGLEPVSVRARSNSEALVVNHVSDSITVVDLAALRVADTILTDDEPCDVVFAGSPQRAFVTISQRNRIAVFDADNRGSPLAVLAIEGEDPRALATDGTTVYAAIFECGNDTTIIDADVVSGPLNPYPGDPNPPPNAPQQPTGFLPALNPALPPAPRVSQIVRKAADGRWLDETGGDWSPAVPWDLHGHDIAVIDANSLAIGYRGGLMTTPMAISMRPGGEVVVVGTEALNEVRFEPVLNGVFLSVEGAVLDPATGTVKRFDLNPHLDYATRTLPTGERALGLGDPRGVAVTEDGSTAYITGMGSSNVVAVSLENGFGARVALGESGEGTTGLVLDEPNSRIFALNRFEGSISILKTDSLGELGTVRFFDPTPAQLRVGRPFLYDTHRSSGLGIASCASCHIDARMDQLAWDLGDPSGVMRPFDQTCDFGQTNACGDWHPMKGPMTTQTLLGLQGDEPFHWRGDRANLAEFGHAASSLMSNGSDFTAAEMANLEAYLSSISRMPNPNRALDGSFRTAVAGGNAAHGAALFATGGLVGGANCIVCHSNAKGGNSSILNAAFAQQHQSVKVAHLSNLYEKTGFDTQSQSNNRGFGFEHDGALGTMIEFLSNPVFTGFLVPGAPPRADMAAFMFSFDTGTHAAVGAQVTAVGNSDAVAARRDELLAVASGGAVDLIVRTSDDSGSRTYAFAPAAGSPPVFQSDVDGETASLEDFELMSQKGVAVTYTVVPANSAAWLLDRDRDGFLDGYELAACSDPADPQSTPLGTCRLDLVDGDGLIGASELAFILAAWGSTDPIANVDCMGVVDAADLSLVLAAWGQCH